jgi:hypothetical protein
MGKLRNGELTAEARRQEQRKSVDTNRIEFDLVNDMHARNSWRLPV